MKNRVPTQCVKESFSPGNLEIQYLLQHPVTSNYSVSLGKLIVNIKKTKNLSVA